MTKNLPTVGRGVAVNTYLTRGIVRGSLGVFRRRVLLWWQSESGGRGREEEKKETRKELSQEICNRVKEEGKGSPEKHGILIELAQRVIIANILLLFRIGITDSRDFSLV
jgi:hypothetical protein